VDKETQIRSLKAELEVLKKHQETSRKQGENFEKKIINLSNKIELKENLLATQEDYQDKMKLKLDIYNLSKKRSDMEIALNYTEIIQTGISRKRHNRIQMLYNLEYNSVQRKRRR